MRDLVLQLEQAGGQERQNLGGHHHHQAVGQRHQPAALAHEGDAQVVVGADHLVGQAQVADQVQRRGLDREKAVGPGLEGAAFHALGLDDAAQARPRFDDGGRARRPWRDSRPPRARRCRRR